MVRHNPAVGKGSRGVLYIALAAIALGIFLRGYHLDRKTLWGDEILGLVRMLGFEEAEIVRAGPRIRTAADVQAYFQVTGPYGGARPLSATIKAYAEEDPQHPPLYYLLARIWVGVAGTSVFALRTLPAIFGVIAIGAMAWLARELFGNPRIIWMAAALYALSPFAVLYSQEAREYSLWSLGTLISSVLLLHAVRTHERRYWLGYGVSTVLCLYLYPLAAFVMVAHATFVAATPALRRREVIVPYLLSSTAATLLFLPWLITLLTSAALRLAMAPLLSNKLSSAAIGLTFLREIRGSVISVAGLGGAAVRFCVAMAGAAVLALIFYALASLLLGKALGAARTFLAALLIVPALPLIGHDLMSGGGGLVSQGRYFAPIYLAVPPLLARLFHIGIGEAGDGRVRAAAWSAAFTLTLVAGAVSCAISAQADTWYNKAFERTPEVAAIINRAAEPLVVADRAIVGDRGTSRVLELSYYLDPGVAMRVNLHCDACLSPPPPPCDIFKDAGRFQNVFVLGELVRNVPTGAYSINHVGIEIDPPTSGPLEMFAKYPH